MNILQQLHAPVEENAEVRVGIRVWVFAAPEVAQSYWADLKRRWEVAEGHELRPGTQYAEAT